MSLYDFRERLLNMLKNRTDGFYLTTIEPFESGLAAYILFNCYGADRRFINPIKHRKMIVEVAKDNGKGRRCGRYDIDDTIPVEVSESPKILLQGRKLKRAISLFNKQEWDDVFCFITRNRSAIERHWLGELSSLELLNTVTLPQSRR